MDRKLTTRRRGSISIPVVFVLGGGLLIVHIFLLETKFPLLLYAIIALCGILMQVSVTRENRVKGDGAQGNAFEIIGKPGIVVQECSPEGKVRIGDGTWSAISHDRKTLRVGEKITIQDIQGPKVTVKREAAAMPTGH
jgi:membrane protein implicated in regulation of membrane protease activity